MYPIAVLLALAASVSAYSVSQPNSAEGWTNDGPQPLVWQRVDTDALNFTVVLTNQNRAIFPQDQVLIAQQDGVVGNTVNCNPPSGGWPLGKAFRVNLVKSTTDQSTIYAQSNEFEIKVPKANVSSSASVITGPTSPVVAPPTTSSTTTPSSDPNAPADPNAATIVKVSTGLMAVLGAVTLFAA